MEPSTPEAKDAVTLVTEKGGTYELTERGTLKSLVIPGATLDESAIDLIAKQTDLETLQIGDYRELNDAMVAKLTGLTQLKSLFLTNSGISDESLKTVAAAFPNLVELNISYNARLTDEALSEVAKLTNLEQLTMIYCNFSEFGIADISELPKLKMLDIRGNMQVGNGGMTYVASLPALKSFKYMCSTVDDFGMEALSEANGLESLEIHEFGISDQSGEYIRKLENLTSLIMAQCTAFGSSGLSALKGLPLTRLTLRGLASVDDPGMETFRELPTLRRLYLQDMPSITDTGLMNLVYLKNLDTLDIQGVAITDKTIETIAKLENLKTLAIKSTNITDASIDLLLQLPRVENLTVYGNGAITPAGVQKLTDSKKFKKLVTEPPVTRR